MDESDKKRLLTTCNTKKGNVRCITITDNIPDHWDSLISIAKSNYEFWAYIYHDKDDGIDKHLHLLCLERGGTSLKSHCRRFESVVPANFVCKVTSPRAMARYLIHLDNPQKFQYARNDVVTSSKDKYASFLSSSSDDVVSQFQDFMSLMQGKISINDYLDKYRGEFASMPFYQKQAFFHKISTSCIVNKSITLGLEDKPPIQSSNT